MAHVGLKPVTPFARVAVLDRVAVSVAFVAILWITAVQVPVILAHALDLPRALWMARADPMQAVRHVTTPDLDHAAVYTATVVMALLSVVPEIGTSSLRLSFKTLTEQ
jgi:type IV secretory pathway TrbD component